MRGDLEIFPWNDNFATGIPEIDQQHRRLVDLLNLLVGHLAYQREAPVIDDVLQELKDYSIVHFEYEETIWRAHLQDDPWVTGHTTSHGNFVRKIIELRNDTSEKSFEQVIEEIVGFLTHWLALHIIESDKRMAKAVTAVQAGASVGVAKDFANAEMSGATRELISTVMGMYDNLAHRTITLTREISARIRIEAELMEAQETLTRLKEEALLREQRAVSDLMNFADVLAHHMQEPVRTQLLFTSDLKKRLGGTACHTPEVAFALEQICSGGERLRLLLRDMQAHLSLSGMHWSPAPCALDTVLDAALCRLAGEIRDKNAHLERHPLPVVTIDAARMTDALTALLHNALTYRRDDAPPLVVVSAAVAEGRLSLAVDDNGIGIPEAYRDRAFRMFERITPERNSGGTGIGLPIVRKIAESAGGSVAIATSALGGTRVTMTLPVG